MGATQSTREPPNPKQSIKPKPKTKYKEVEFKLHIAIDLGTDGCGLAFAYNDEETKEWNVKVYNKWEAQQTSSNTKVTTKKKTKTQLILNKKNEVVCFGNPAKFMYYNLSDNIRNEQRFFERFKMALYEKKLSRSHIVSINGDDDEKKRDEVKTATYLTACNGDKIESKFVFIAAFKELQKIAKEFIPKNITNDKIKDEEIQWILTVPAIWSESAKDKMRKWITRAGLVNDKIINQCIIVYEPDCASLSMQKQYFDDLSKRSQGISFNDDDKKKRSNKFEEGEKYILIDAGGGTVDIACHKILGDGFVEEIIYPTGDKWGSCYIDDLYIKLLETIFSKEWIDEYQKKESANFVQLKENFQSAKISFYKNSQSVTNRILLPSDFMQFLEHKYSKTKSSPEQKIEEFVKSKDSQYFYNLFSNDDAKYEEEGVDSGVCILKLIKIRDEEDDDDSDVDDDEYDYVEYLEMDSKIWKCLFDSKINAIISHVDELLNMNELKDCKYLGLVGGLSCSKYFQFRMKKQFGIESKYKLKVIIPKKPMLSVVRGAAWMSVTKQYIRARKLKYTYGMMVYLTEDDAKKRGISHQYISNNKTDKGMIKDCFNVIIRKGDRIQFNQAILEKVHKISGKTSAVIRILYSDNINPKVSTDGIELGLIEIHFDGDNDEVMVEFQFYRTMFKVYSYPKSDPNAREEVSIKY